MLLNFLQYFITFISVLIAQNSTRARAGYVNIYSINTTRLLICSLALIRLAAPPSPTPAPDFHPGLFGRRDVVSTCGYISGLKGR